MTTKFILPASGLLLLLFGCEPDLNELNNTAKKLEQEIKANQKDLAEVYEAIALLDSSVKEVEQLSVVSTLIAKKKPFAHYFQIQGQVNSKKNALLSPEYGGTITAIHVQEGQKIEKGTLVATFSSSLISSNIDELNEQLDLAKYVFEKQQALKEQGVGTAISYKEAEANYNRLIKAKNTLIEQKDKFSLYAPFSGYVDKLFVTQGQTSPPMSPILRLVSLNHLFVNAQVSENHLSKINKGQPVSIEFPALKENLNGLEISRLGNQIDPVNRTITVEVPIPSKEKLIPNLMAILSICDYSDTNSIVVPSSLILENNRGEHIVKTVSRGEVAINKIEKGRQYNNYTQILSGLTIGDTLVEKGKNSVAEGQKVKILNR